MGRVRVETQGSCPSPQPQPQSLAISHGAQPYQSPQQLLPKSQAISHGALQCQPPHQFYEHQPKHVVPINNNNNMQLVSNNGVYLQEYHQQSSPMQMPQNVGVPSKATFQNTTATGFPQQGPMSPLQVNNNSSNNAGMVPSLRWTTGLFDCMEDPTNALVTATFPCVTFGQIADVLDNGNTTCATSGIIYAAAPCLVSRPYRRKLRQRFGLVEAPSSDWIVHSMFEPCALCQEYRELFNRGIDPALGYHGNENLKKRQVQKNPIPMVPPGNQMMMN